ncbi:hypothetical protein HXX76_010397 [Chlamydomonas incerta]|uniref:non-specific serine/threonine protein kinase n=1 Tax=Chlamydomonas incerta TaxID=51695 RepID=A0A835SMD0_CHLIN|nr:hypothetical protein HXX76_010397 [Chlamydomonas incerta]|eukprot:KAG2422616.1 hypothetical protein HXX76_010397 [Chlamydomonas incerta]
MPLTALAGASPWPTGPTTEAEEVETSPSGRYIRYNILLGKGACKRVYKAFDTEEGTEVAWNQVDLLGMDKDEEARQHLYEEIRVLQKLKHKNIMTFHAWWSDDVHKHINFITELFTAGNLRQYRKKLKYMSENVLKRWSHQILEGLLYLHGHVPPIVHRDLKCDNIFVNSATGEIKIGDLGLATVQQQGMSVVGTPEFMAPEVYDESYDERCDIYSFGMCLLELATLEYPYAECHSVPQIFKKVTLGIPPASLQRVSSPELRDFIALCIAHNPADRPSARELLKHRYLESVHADTSAHGGLPGSMSVSGGLAALGAAAGGVAGGVAGVGGSVAAGLAGVGVSVAGVGGSVAAGLAGLASSATGSGWNTPSATLHAANSFRDLREALHQQETLARAQQQLLHHAAGAGGHVHPHHHPPQHTNSTGQLLLPHAHSQPNNMPAAGYLPYPHPPHPSHLAPPGLFAPGARGPSGSQAGGGASVSANGMAPMDTGAGPTGGPTAHVSFARNSPQRGGSICLAALHVPLPCSPPGSAGVGMSPLLRSNSIVPSPLGRGAGGSPHSGVPTSSGIMSDASSPTAINAAANAAAAQLQQQRLGAPASPMASEQQQQQQGQGQQPVDYRGAPSAGGGAAAASGRPTASAPMARMQSGDAATGMPAGSRESVFIATQRREQADEEAAFRATADAAARRQPEAAAAAHRATAQHMLQERSAAVTPSDALIPRRPSWREAGGSGATGSGGGSAGPRRTSSRSSLGGGRRSRRSSGCSGSNETDSEDDSDEEVLVPIELLKAGMLEEGFVDEDDDMDEGDDEDGDGAEGAPGVASVPGGGGPGSGRQMLSYSSVGSDPSALSLVNPMLLSPGGGSLGVGRAAAPGSLMMFDSIAEQAEDEAAAALSAMAGSASDHSSLSAAASAFARLSSGLGAESVPASMRGTGTGVSLGAASGGGLMRAALGGPCGAAAAAAADSAPPYSFDLDPAVQQRKQHERRSLELAQQQQQQAQQQQQQHQQHSGAERSLDRKSLDRVSSHSHSRAGSFGRDSNISVGIAAMSSSPPQPSGVHELSRFGQRAGPVVSTAAAAAAAAGGGAAGAFGSANVSSGTNATGPSPPGTAGHSRMGSFDVTFGASQQQQQQQPASAGGPGAAVEPAAAAASAAAAEPAPPLPPPRLSMGGLPLPPLPAGLVYTNPTQMVRGQGPQGRASYSGGGAGGCTGSITRPPLGPHLSGTIPSSSSAAMGAIAAAAAAGGGGGGGSPSAVVKLPSFRNKVMLTSVPMPLAFGKLGGGGGGGAASLPAKAFSTSGVPAGSDSEAGGSGRLDSPRPAASVAPPSRYLRTTSARLRTGGAHPDIKSYGSTCLPATGSSVAAADAAFGRTSMPCAGGADRLDPHHLQSLPLPHRGEGPGAASGSADSRQSSVVGSAASDVLLRASSTGGGAGDLIGLVGDPALFTAALAGTSPGSGGGAAGAAAAAAAAAAPHAAAPQAQVSSGAEEEGSDSDYDPDDPLAAMMRRRGHQMARPAMPVLEEDAAERDPTSPPAATAAAAASAASASLAAASAPAAAAAADVSSSSRRDSGPSGFSTDAAQLAAAVQGGAEQTVEIISQGIRPIMGVIMRLKQWKRLARDRARAARGPAVAT